jgi:chemotaxis signal transduction protein
VFTDDSDTALVDAGLDVQASLPLSQNRYILTQVGHQQLSFPSQWVSEILTIERSQILPLPCYHPLLLGVTHHQGQIVPLISPDAFQVETTNRFARSSATEILSIVRLSRATQHLCGVGVVIEQVLGNRSKEQLALSQTSIHAFDLQEISDTIWRPQPWLFNRTQNSTHDVNHSL